MTTRPCTREYLRELFPDARFDEFGYELVMRFPGLGYIRLSRKFTGGYDHAACYHAACQADSSSARLRETADAIRKFADRVQTLERCFPSLFS